MNDETTPRPSAHHIEGPATYDERGRGWMIWCKCGRLEWGETPARATEAMDHHIELDGGTAIDLPAAVAADIARLTDNRPPSLFGYPLITDAKLDRGWTHGLRHDDEDDLPRFGPIGGRRTLNVTPITTRAEQRTAAAMADLHRRTQDVADELVRHGFDGNEPPPGPGPARRYLWPALATAAALFTIERLARRGRPFQS